MTTNTIDPQKKLVLITSRLQRPTGTATRTVPLTASSVEARLINKLRTLDGEQLQIVEIVIAAILRGAR